MPSDAAGGPPPVTPAKPTATTEASAYLDGLCRDFQEQAKRYLTFTAELVTLEARIEFAEKTLCLTRDHLAMTIAQTDAAISQDCEHQLRAVRFVGVRLVDACMVLLQEHKKLTLEEILAGLSAGAYLFRTASPLREIHAALLKQQVAKRVGGVWIWEGGQKPMPLRLRPAKAEATRPAGTARNPGETSEQKRSERQDS